MQGAPLHSLRQIFAALVAVMVALHGAPALAADVVTLAALKRTEAALANKEVHGDVGFLITQGAKRRGNRVALQPLASLVANKAQAPYSTEYALWEMRNTALPRLSFPLPSARGKDFDPLQATALSRPDSAAKAISLQGPIVFEVMANALNCKPGGNALEITGRPGYEYIATHQVFGVLVVAQRECHPRAVLGQLLGLYVGRVRDEFELQLSDKKLTDLQIERAAMLCMVSRCDLVPASFFKRVVDAQGRDGLWHLDDPLIKMGAFPVQHPTALAYFLLAHSPL